MRARARACVCTLFRQRLRSRPRRAPHHKITDHGLGCLIPRLSCKLGLIRRRSWPVPVALISIVPAPRNLM